MAIGRSVERVDARAKVTGRARYTDDFTMPGMLHAAYVRSKVPFGQVVAISTDKARAMPGVVAVFTFADVPKVLFPTAGHPFDLDEARRDKADRLLLTDTPRYVGDEVAVVVARDALTASLAARAVDVEYEEFPFMVTPAEALAPEAMPIHPGGNLLGAHHFEVNGQADERLAGLPHVVSGTYKTPMVAHCHLEVHTAYAYMDDLERIVVVSSTQIPHICRRVVGQALSIPWGRVRVVKPVIGGGFGAKQDVVLEPMAAFLTQKLGGAAVALTLSREECMLATRTRHALEITGTLGLSDTGQVEAFKLSAVSNTGAYASHGHSIVAAGGAKLTYMYPRAAIRFEGRSVYTNCPVGGAMRGYGSPQMVFALDCLVEQAARKAGLDPLDVRLASAGRPGDVNPMSHKPMPSHGLVRCLEEGRRLFGYDERRSRLKDQSGRIRHGLGVSCFSFGSGTFPICTEMSGARLIVNQDGSVNLVTGAAEIGQGSDTVMAQVAAQTLGVPFETIRVVVQQDTDVTPFDPGAYASRQTYVCTPAVQQAAADLRAKILRHAALMLDRPAGGLDLREGSIVDATEPEIALTSLPELAMHAYYDRHQGSQLMSEASYKVTSNAPSFGATFVEVAVDVELCKARVTDILNVHDAGRIVNPALAEFQVHGGMSMGIGWALYEELLVDRKSGRTLNANLLDYKLPTIMDLPRLRAAFVETDEPTGACGAKSLGEPPVLSVAPAIRNAVWDATGVRIDEIPLTPKVLFTHFSRAGLL